jgi:phage terminase Nu1 subunit (DNA packaging protein)
MIDTTDDSITVSVNALAAVLNLTPRRVQQHRDEGTMPRDSHGEYPLFPAITAYIKYLQDRVSGRKSSADQHAERTRLTAAQAEKTELEVQEIKGDLIRADAVYRNQHRAGTILKNNLLSIADRQAAILAAETDPGRVHELLTDEIKNGLTNVIEALASSDDWEDASLDITRRDALAALDEQAQDIGGMSAE